MPLVAVVMGSKSDTEAIKPALDTLDELGIPYEVKVISAHRNPEKAREYGLAARSRGAEVIIAAAGGAGTGPDPAADSDAFNSTAGADALESGGIGGEPGGAAGHAARRGGGPGGGGRRAVGAAVRAAERAVRDAAGGGGDGRRADAGEGARRTETAGGGRRD